MNTSFKKKKTVIDTNKTVRATIDLNKGNNIQYMYMNCYVSENITWPQNWIEQSIEMKSKSESVSFESFKKIKLIMKWWEN